MKKRGAGGRPGATPNFLAYHTTIKRLLACTHNIVSFSDLGSNNIHFFIMNMKIHIIWAPARGATNSRASSSSSSARLLNQIQDLLAHYPSSDSPINTNRQKKETLSPTKLS